MQKIFVNNLFQGWIFLTKRPLKILSSKISCLTIILQVIKQCKSDISSIINTHPYSVSSLGGDGLIPNIRFSRVKDPLRFIPVEPDVGYM